MSIAHHAVQICGLQHCVSTILSFTMFEQPETLEGAGLIAQNDANGPCSQELLEG